MRISIKAFIAASVFCTFLSAEEFQKTVVKGTHDLNIEESNESVKIKSVPKGTVGKKKKTAVSYASRLITNEDGKGNALSFEFKGDGSTFFASVFLGASKNLLDAHEAVFPLSSTTWQKRVIPFEEFVRNGKPWNKPKMTEENIHPNMNKLRYLGFGRGFKFHRFIYPDYSFEIRNVKFVQVPKLQNLALKKGLTTFLAKLKTNEPVKILLLGDSITEHGKDLSHTYHAMELLGKKAQVVNAAIGGQSARCGEIVLERSLKKLPNPDLIVIMYGANDCNNISEGSGFNDVVFKKHLMNLIHKVNRGTKGQSEFLLLNGVPRVDKKTRISKKLVEPLIPAFDRVSREHGLVLCDTMGRFLKLSKEEKDSYYKDSIHQSQKGLKFMGQVIAEKIESLLSGEFRRY